MIIKIFEKFNPNIEKLITVISNELTLIQDIFDLTQDIHDITEAEHLKIRSRIFFVPKKEQDTFNVYVLADKFITRGILFNLEDENIQRDIEKWYNDLYFNTSTIHLGLPDSKFDRVNRLDNLIEKIESGDIVIRTGTFFWSPSNIGDFKNDIDDVSKRIDQMYCHNRVLSRSGTGIWIIT